MNFSEIERMARFEIADEVGTDKTRLVKSWQLLAYANEAETEACIRARLLVDSTTAEICTIPLVSGESVYNHDPRIVLIVRGLVTGAHRPMKRVSFTVLDEHYHGWGDATGTVEAFVTGMDKGKIRLFRKPTANATLSLTVVRRPLKQMAEGKDYPEIPDHLHHPLVLWIKHRVYNNQDSELFDKNRADVHLAQFTALFGPRPVDRNDVFDAMQIPQYTPESHHSDYDDMYY